MLEPFNHLSYIKQKVEELINEIEPRDELKGKVMAELEKFLIRVKSSNGVTIRHADRFIEGWFKFQAYSTIKPGEESVLYRNALRRLGCKIK